VAANPLRQYLKLDMTENREAPQRPSSGRLKQVKTQSLRSSLFRGTHRVIFGKLQSGPPKRLAAPAKVG
jgi:hypothetical protein